MKTDNADILQLHKLRLQNNSLKSSIISNGGENEYHPTSLSDFEEDDDFFGIDSTEKNRQSGSHFYVFSIYQRSTTEKSKRVGGTEEDISPY